jgi:hypothetical protein
VLVQLRSRVPNIAHRAGKHVSESEVAILLNGDAEVYKPNGEPLLILRRGAISKDVCEIAYPALHGLKRYGSGNNRGAYTGAKRPLVRHKDGTISKSTHTRDENGKTVAVASVIAGYFDRQGGRFPFCRETVFVGKEPEQWSTVMPMVDRVAEVFRATLPARYAKQFALAKQAPKQFVIGKTPFTTLTVNNNVAGAIHQDKGDYKDGFGCISVVRRGTYSGCWLVFPEYAVAADLQDGDLLFFNSHDWHANTPFRDTQEGYERISVVYYFRSKMVECGTPAQEIERARKRYGSLDGIPQEP